jgi:hypothetical protein
MCETGFKSDHGLRNPVRGLLVHTISGFNGPHTPTVVCTMYLAILVCVMEAGEHVGVHLRASSLAFQGVPNAWQLATWLLLEYGHDAFAVLPCGAPN